MDASSSGIRNSVDDLQSFPNCPESILPNDELDIMSQLGIGIKEEPLDHEDLEVAGYYPHIQVNVEDLPFQLTRQPELKKRQMQLKKNMPPLIATKFQPPIRKRKNIGKSVVEKKRTKLCVLPPSKPNPEPASKRSIKEKVKPLPISSKRLSKTISNFVNPTNATAAVLRPVIVGRPNPRFKCVVRMTKLRSAEITKYTGFTANILSSLLDEIEDSESYDYSADIKIEEPEFESFPNSPCPTSPVQDELEVAIPTPPILTNIDRKPPTMGSTVSNENLQSTEMENKSNLSNLRSSSISKIPKCDGCQRVFSRASGLAYHLQQTAPPDAVINCQECNETFPRLNCLNYHIQQNHPKMPTTTLGSIARRRTGPPKCEDCKREFTRPQGLAYHLQQKPTDEPMRCTQCDLTFKRINCLNYHVQQIHNAFPAVRVPKMSSSKAQPGIVCEICGKSFTRMSGLVYHARLHTGQPSERKFICDEKECGKTFIQKGHLTEHKRIHTGEKIQCRRCSVMLSGINERRNHDRKVHGVIPKVVKKIYPPGTKRIRKPPKVLKFKCTFCDRLFRTSQSRKVHERSHTGEKPFLCSLCGSSFKSALSLREHDNVVHSLIKPFACDICGTRFGRKMSLNYHKISQHAPKKFKCDICQKTFTVKSGLTKHKRSHTTEKQFACDLCPNRYKQLYGLKFHVKRTHCQGTSLVQAPGRLPGPGQSSIEQKRIRKSKPRSRPKLPLPMQETNPEKMFTCPTCSKSFDSAKSLKRHEKYHSADKKYTCNICSKAFLKNYDLKRHLKVHEKGEKLNCPHCSSQFRGTQRLEEHIGKKHYFQLLDSHNSNSTISPDRDSSGHYDSEKSPGGENVEFSVSETSTSYSTSVPYLNYPQESSTSTYTNVNKNSRDHSGVIASNSNSNHNYFPPPQFNYSSSSRYRHNRNQ